MKLNEIEVEVLRVGDVVHVKGEYEECQVSAINSDGTYILYGTESDFDYDNIPRSDIRFLYRNNQG